MTTRLCWHPKATKKARAAAVEAARRAGYKRATDTGEALSLPHRKNDLGPVVIFLLTPGKLFSGIE